MLDSWGRSNGSCAAKAGGKRGQTSARGARSSEDQHKTAGSSGVLWSSGVLSRLRISQLKRLRGWLGNTRPEVAELQGNLGPAHARYPRNRSLAATARAVDEQEGNEQTADARAAAQAAGQGEPVHHRSSQFFDCKARSKTLKSPDSTNGTSAQVKNKVRISIRPEIYQGPDKQGERARESKLEEICASWCCMQDAKTLGAWSAYFSFIFFASAARFAEVWRVRARVKMTAWSGRALERIEAETRRRQDLPLWTVASALDFCPRGRCSVCLTVFANRSTVICPTSVSALAARCVVFTVLCSLCSLRSGVSLWMLAGCPSGVWAPNVGTRSSSTSQASPFDFGSDFLGTSTSPCTADESS